MISRSQWGIAFALPSIRLAPLRMLSRRAGSLGVLGRGTERFAVRKTVGDTGFLSIGWPTAGHKGAAAALEYRMPSRRWRSRQLLRPRQSLRLARFADRRFRDLERCLRLSFKRLQLDLRPLPTAHRSGAR